MELFILRHAVAEDRTEHPMVKDSERPLTSKGEKKLKGVIKGMKVLGLSFDVIISSPYVRAKRTAEIVAEEFQLMKRLEFSEQLMPDGNPKLLLDYFKARHAKGKQALFVGHEPYLSRLISLLVSGDTSTGIDLKKAGLCKLSIEDLDYGRCARLEWLLTPRQLREIGKS